MKIGIIGMGGLGLAQKRWLGDRIHVTYDPKHDDEYPAGQLAECDFIIVCVSTPGYANGECDTSYVEAAMREIPFGRPVLLRSTVPPGTSERYPNTVYCPDFIQDGSLGNWRDPDDVPFLILGGPGDLTRRFTKWLAPVFPNNIYRCSARVAELVKFTVNAFLATKVTYANEMSRIAAAYGVDWRDVQELWLKDPRTGYTHTSVTEEGGFGGNFTENLAAIIYAASLGDYNADFLMAVEEANERFRQ